MSKLLIIFGLFLISLGANAGVCNNGTVATSGGYSFSLTNTGGSAGQSTSFIDAGRMVFNGAAKGVMSVSGFEYAGGSTRTISVNGTYSVSTSCVMTAVFSLPATSPLTVAKTFTVTVYLDRLDAAPLTNVAYHGNAIFRTSNSLSGVGVFDRVIGKF
jgi:hypothetical protein